MIERQRRRWAAYQASDAQTDWSRKALSSTRRRLAGVPGRFDNLRGLDEAATARSLRQAAGMTGDGGLSAKLELLNATRRPGQKLGYKIANTGSVELTCGLLYRLERYADGGWITMNSEAAFRLIGFGVGPGQSRDLDATIPLGAPAGLYRISTSVTTDHGGGAADLAAEFEVSPDH
jgi:hypothetical protein